MFYQHVLIVTSVSSLTMRYKLGYCETNDFIITRGIVNKKGDLYELR